MKDPPVWGKVTDARRNATVAEYNVFLNRKKVITNPAVSEGMQIKIISHPTSLALWLLLLLLFSGALQLSALSAKGYEQD